jgi:hypothetical protein
MDERENINTLHSEIRAPYRTNKLLLLGLVFAIVIAGLVIGTFATDFSKLEQEDRYALIVLIILVSASLALTAANIKQVGINASGITFYYPFWIIRQRFFPFSKLKQIQIIHPFKQTEDTTQLLSHGLRASIEVKLMMKNGKRFGDSPPFNWRIPVP